MADKRYNRDIVVIGASAGGVDAVLKLVAGLPADLPSAVFVVIHMQAGFASKLPELLTQQGPLPAAHAVHGEAVTPGRIYVAPPDNQLLVRNGYVEVVRGPKENGHRPSVDALFRTASAAYGPRVIGVVLTGYLDCGTAGMLSIKARGGLAVAQDPSDAAVSEMPSSAIKHAPVDHVTTLDQLAPLLSSLTREAAGEWPAHVRSEVLQIEGAEPGSPAELVCPACNGKITESELGGFQIFRCHVGHAFSLKSISSAQAEEVERALWAAARALDEGAALSRRLVSSARGEMRQRFLEKAEAQSRQADVIRKIILRGDRLSPEDAPAVDSAPIEESS
jgi:two-component system, chemotaxis family, protein-glutamate methylesterase/glutaminase